MFVVWLVEMVIVCLTMVANFYRQLIVLHEKANKLEESAIKSQYIALQNQLNPHFLFNNLNTLISPKCGRPETGSEPSAGYEFGALAHRSSDYAKKLRTFHGPNGVYATGIFPVRPNRYHG